MQWILNIGWFIKLILILILIFFFFKRPTLPQIDEFDLNEKELKIIGKYVELMKISWKHLPSERPTFIDIVGVLESLLNDISEKVEN